MYKNILNMKYFHILKTKYDTNIKYFQKYFFLLFMNFHNLCDVFSCSVSLDIVFKIRCCLSSYARTQIIICLYLNLHFLITLNVPNCVNMLIVNTEMTIKSIIKYFVVLN